MPRGYKTFFMLNSVEHEIFNAHKYKNSRRDCLIVKLLSLTFDTELPDEFFPGLGALCYKTLERVTRGISLY